MLREVKVRPGSINGLPCQSYSLNYERGNTVYLETLDGGLVIRNDGMYWNQVILDQEAVLLRPGQEPEPTPHCPDLPEPCPSLRSPRTDLCTARPPAVRGEASPR